MGKTVIRVTFDDDLEAARFLQTCRRKGMDAMVEDPRPIGRVKRNGPDLASWLLRNPGWHTVLEATNRHAAWNAAWKINHGQRRGFETLAYEARAVNTEGAWTVEARRKPATRTTAPSDGDMDPLF